MANPLTRKERRPVGQAWLRQELGLEVPPPAVESYLVAGARRTEVDGSRIIELYPRQYAPGESLVSHLRFMLRHEPADLGVLAASLEAIDPSELETWVKAEPTGAYSRRTWFFYETFTGRTLDLEDVRSGSYVDALDAARHVTGERRRSRRHRVADNLLGGPGFCPAVRRTPRLSERISRTITTRRQLPYTTASISPLSRSLPVGNSRDCRERSVPVFSRRPGQPTYARIASLTAAPIVLPWSKACALSAR